MAGQEKPGFQVDRESLLKTLQRVQSVVDRKNTIPILSHILVEAVGNEVIFSATDLEVGVRVKIPARVLQSGKVALPAKSLYEIVRELTSESQVKVQIFENFWVEILSGKSVFKLVGQDSDEFPQLPQIDQSKSVKLTSGQFAEMIDHTIFAVSSDQTRYDLSGVFLEQLKAKSKSYLRMVATDGHRLSMMDQEIEGMTDGILQSGVILPRKGLTELRRILAEEDFFFLSLQENNAVFWSPTQQFQLFMRLLDGEFPDYTPVIPQNNDKRVVVRREQLLNSLKRISVLSMEHSRSVKFQFHDGKLQLFSSNPKLGEAKEDVDIDYQGEAVEIGFNAGYFIDILNALDDQENIVMELTDTLSPSVVKGIKFDGSLNIVMPMQLGSDQV
ncbi:MAG: DNA polymerase III subunit beta [Bradymonadales bacterium]|nr:MAG: DNA polymerase III subunit beta [Bradymonadales bacterium]